MKKLKRFEKEREVEEVRGSRKREKKMKRFEKEREEDEEVLERERRLKDDDIVYGTRRVRTK